jgi:hypothetical protein
MATKRRAEPKPFTAVVADGDVRAQLEALRDLLAERLIGAELPQVAPLARQLQAVVTQLAALPSAKTEANPVDDLAARRRARRADASDPGGAAGGDVGGSRGRRAR